jgi:hypothetical protein
MSSATRGAMRHLCAIVVIVAAVTAAIASTETTVDVGVARILCGNQTPGLRNGPLSSASFDNPHRVLQSPFDDSTLYITDFGNHVVRRIDLVKGTITNWLGSGASGDATGVGNSARLASPVDLVSDPNDVLFVFVTVHAGIRRVEVETASMTFFTGVGAGYAEGPAATANFTQPQSMAVHYPTRDLLLVDQMNGRVRRVNSITGFTALVAGNGAEGWSDGVGADATFNRAIGLAFAHDQASTLFLADRYNHCLRQIVLTAEGVGNVTSASPCGGPGMLDGTLPSALFNLPHSIARPPATTVLFLADTMNRRVRRIDPVAQWVDTVVGRGDGGVASNSAWAGASSSVDALIGPAIAVAFACRDNERTMYVTGQHAILAVALSEKVDVGRCLPTSVDIGPVALVAGLGVISGAIDGAIANASFELPATVIPIQGGTVLIALDELNHVLRRVNLTSNTVDTWVGEKGVANLLPGTGRGARLRSPRRAIVHPQDANVIIVVNDVALVTVSLDTARVAVLSGDGALGYADGPPSTARFTYASSVVHQPNTKDLIVADIGNCRLRRVSLVSGYTSSLAGSGAQRSVDGVGFSAKLSGPIGLATSGDAQDKLFVSEYWGHCLRLVALSSLSVTTLSPCGFAGRARDGPLRAARFNSPCGLTTIPGSSDFFVSECGGNRVRMVDFAMGWVLAVIGTGDSDWQPSSSSLSTHFPAPCSTVFAVSPGNEHILYVSFKSSIARVDLRNKFLLRAAGHQSTHSASNTHSLSNPRRATSTLTVRCTTTATLRQPREWSLSTSASISTSTLPRTSAPPIESLTTAFSVVSRSLEGRLKLTSITSMTSRSKSAAPDSSSVLRGVLPARLSTIPPTATTAATGVAAVATALVGFVGLPVAARPAVAGAAIRMSTCVADGANGPEVPPYEAMPAQFAVLGTPAATAGSAVLSNAAVVLLGLVGGYAAAGNGQANLPRDKRNPSRAEPTSLRASMAHAASTAPFSYISPALVEFSVMWLSAAAAPGSTFTLGAWAAGFVVGLSVALGSWALLTWRGHAVAVDVRDEARTECRDGRWMTLVGPLIVATRDVTSPRVRYAFFVELGCSLLFSALSGIRVESLCVAKCVAATLVALAFLGYLLIVQPAAERMDHWFGVGFAALQVLTGALLAAAVLDGRGRSGQDESSSSTWSSTAVDVAECVSLATLTLIVVQAVVGLVVAVRGAVRGACRSVVEANSLDGRGLDQRLLTVPSSNNAESNDTAGVPDESALVDCSARRSEEETRAVNRISNPLLRR